MKTMQMLGLLACVLLLAGVTNAGDVTIQHAVDYTYNQFPLAPWPAYYFWHESLNPIIDHPPYFRYMWQDWGWTHDLTALAPADATGIQRAVLSIRAWGVDEEDRIQVHNGTSWEYVGQLQGAIGQWFTTSFELSATLLQELLRSGKLEVYIDIDYAEEGGRVTLGSSTLDVDYTSQGKPPVGRYTLSVSSTAGGSVFQPGEGSFQYDPGTQVLLEARPDPLFKFVGWRGSILTDRNPSVVTMDNNLAVTAHFESVLDTIYVDDDDPRNPSSGGRLENGTAEYPFDRIQEAIEIAGLGARIIVRPGNYFETIDLLGKSIEVTGLDSSDPNNIVALPVIDGGGKDTVVKCISGEDPNCILCGLVITGGKGPLGGGILCLGGSPTIQNCLIVGNRATAVEAGGGVYCQDSNAVFVNCTISDNYGGSAGAGIYLSQSNATILDSIVWENAPVQIVEVGHGRSVVAYTAVMRGWSGQRIVTDDPRFAGPGYWADPMDPRRVLPATDPTGVWVSGDYHLMSKTGRWDPLSGTWVRDPMTSPCIDAGDPIASVGHEPLPNNGRVNLGAYGGTTQASKSLSDK